MLPALHPVQVGEKATLANLLQLYLHDLSEFTALECDDRGVFSYPYLPNYFVEAGREACFIRVDKQLVGFTMTRQLPDGGREIAEFFVLRSYRRRGIGWQAARTLFGRYRGRWSVRYADANEAAARFWPRVAASVADDAAACYKDGADGAGRELRFTATGSDAARPILSQGPH